ncbi:MAG: hypothetical protein ACRYG8_13530, partial [Janthinobacterium lividum]
PGERRGGQRDRPLPGPRRAREGQRMSARSPIADSLAAAPPEQTVAEWARTSFEGRALMIFRDLPPKGQEAFLQAGRRLADGVPPCEAARLAFQEAGMSEAEVAEAMASLPALAGEA